MADDVAQGAIELDARPWLSGLGFPEGLRWHLGRLHFSDVVRGHVLHAAPGAPSARTVVTIAGRPSGMGFLRDGSMLIATMQDRLVHRVDSSESTTYADLRTFAPRLLNDMVVDEATGAAYVDAYGETDTDGRIVVVRPGGSMDVATDEVEYPNGLIVLPGREMIVADTNERCLHSFEMLDNGRLRPAPPFARCDGWAPDGLCADASGAVWVGAVFNDCFLRVERGGRITHVIRTPGRWAVSCVLGGAHMRTLFMATAETDRARFGVGDSRGWILTATVPIPGQT